ncbi:MAG: 23S rRNA (guanosine(2251)-2'-O)-methyltransferase RlmB [Bacilli bacterium]|jgi:23S rRNA (guanosine2251-2'-O)-methyltransferase
MGNLTQYIYGRNAVLESLETGRVLKVFLTPSFSGTDLVARLTKQGVAIERKENDWIAARVGPRHQGIAALIKAYEFTPLEAILKQADQAPYPLLVVLDSIQDPQNFGAIIRNADAFGAHGLVVKKDRQVGLTNVVVKVSSGAIAHVPVAQVTNLSQLIKQLKTAGYWIVSSALQEAIDYRNFDYRRKIALIVGSEGDGIAELVRRNSDVVVKIPMTGKINSINASAATAVLLAEIQSQRFPR